MAEAGIPDLGQNWRANPSDITTDGCFGIECGRHRGVVQMVWLEHEIYISYHGLKAVRVFADQAPFQELEPVQIEAMEDPCSMAASAKSHAIYISESRAKRIWKLNLPNRIPELLMFQTGNPGPLSVTPKSELLAVFESPYNSSKNDTPGAGVDIPLGDQRYYYSIELFQLENDRQRTSIPLPLYFQDVGCAVQSLDENFIVSHSNYLTSGEFRVSVVSKNDGDVIRELILGDRGRLFSLRSRVEAYPHHIAINHEGFIYVADSELRMLFVFNPQATRVRVIHCNNISKQECQPFRPMRIAYNNGRLLVQNAQGFDEADPNNQFLKIKPKFYMLNIPAGPE